MICKDKYESERFVLSHTCNAAIMGGYIRDMILERPWKDIDLFHSVPVDCVEKCAKGLQSSLLWYKPDGKAVLTRWDAVSKPGYESDFCVMQCKDLPGVQLILFSQGYNKRKSNYDTCLSYMHSHFPCTLSRVAMNLEAKPHERVLYMSGVFEWAVRQQELEFSAHCPQEYRDRMVSYFPHFTITPPPPSHFF